MRTKNKKWTVPILALVPVLALAAFLAVGLFTPNNAEALGDAECGFVIPVSGTITATMGDTSLTVPCYSLVDSVDIIIENNNNESGTEADRPVNVYLSGGSDYAKVQLAVITLDNVEYAASEGISEHKLDVPQPDRRNIPGKATVTVTRAMAKSGVVIAHIYEGSNNFTALNGLAAGSTEIPGGASVDATMVIVFLDMPTLTQADGDDAGTDRDPSSTFQIGTPLPVGVTDVEGEEGMYNIRGDDPDTANDNENVGMVEIIATIRDGNGRALVDGSEDVDSSVTFTYEYTMGSSMKPSRILMASRTEDVNDMAMATIELDDWKSTGAVRVTVSAMYSGPTGSLDLGEVVISPHRSSQEHRGRHLWLRVR